MSFRLLVPLKKHDAQARQNAQATLGLVVYHPVVGERLLASSRIPPALISGFSFPGSVICALGLK
jgi:hypothetical protein